MYCKNCGNEIGPNAAACPHCGFAKGSGLNYCYNCGKDVVPGAAVCTACGAALDQQVFGKSKLAAGLLAIFLGSLGIHNFYLGYTGKAIVQLLISVLTCFIASPFVALWAFVEGIMIFSGHINQDASGSFLRD